MKFNQKLLYLILLINFSAYYLYSQESSQVSQSAAPAVKDDNVIVFDDTEKEEVKVLPPEPVKVGGKEVKIGLTMDIPVIGKVTLYPEEDKQTGKSVLKATLTGKSINLSPVPVKFDNFSIIMPEDKAPGVSADVTCFGKKATLELVELKKKSDIKAEPVAGTKFKNLSLPVNYAHFRIIFKDKPTVPLLPSNSVKLNYVDLILQQGKTVPTLSANINIFGTSVNVNFGFNKQNVNLTFSISKTSLGDLVPEIKKTDFNKITLSTISLSTEFKLGAAQEITPAAQKDFSLTFSSNANFSGLKIAGLDISLDKLHLKAFYNQDKGLTFEVELDKLNIPVINSKINNAKFDFYSAKAVKAKAAEASKSKNSESASAIKILEQVKSNKDFASALKSDKPLLILSGKGTVNLPSIGDFNLDLLANYSAEGFDIKASINKPVSLTNFSIDKAILDVNLKTKVITIEGDANIKGFNVTVKLVGAPDPSGKTTKYSLTASVLQKAWQPFKDVKNAKFPDFLKSIALKNMSLVSGLKKSGDTGKLEAEFTLKGEAEVLGIDIKPEIMFIKNKGGSDGIVLKAKVSTGKLPYGFNKLPIKNAFLIANSVNYTDKDTGLYYGADTLNLSGKVSLTGKLLEPIAKVIGKKNAELNIKGSLSKDLKDSSLSIVLSEGIPIKGSIVSIGPVTIIITPGGPSIALNISLILHPTKGETLNFSGMLSASPTDITGTLGMAGMWKSPFGIHGLSVGNITLALGINPETFAELPVPSKFAFGGTIGLAKDKFIELDIYEDWAASQVGFKGALTGAGGKPGKLSLLDIVNFFAKGLGVKIDTNTVPEIEIQDVDVSFADFEVRTKSIIIPQGIVIKGELHILNKKVAIDFEVDKTGIKAKADMSPISLGPIKITAGKTADGKVRKTKFGGPEIDIELSPEQQKFLISVMLAIKDILTGSGDIEISKSGINFNFEVDVGPGQAHVFKAQAKGQSSGPISNPNFKLTIDMKQDFTKYAAKEISSALKSAEDKLKSGINDAVKKIKKMDSAIKNHKKDLDEAEKKLDKINTAIKKADSKIDGWEHKVDGLNKDIKKKKDKLNDLKKKIGGGSLSVENNFRSRVGGSIWSKFKHGVEKAGKAIEHAGKEAGKGIKKAGEQVGKGFEQFGKILEKGFTKAYKQTAKEAEKLANKAKYAGQIAIISGEIAGLETAYQTTKGTLESFKAATYAGLKAAQVTAQKALEGVKKLDVATMKATRDALIAGLKGAEKAGAGVLKGSDFVFKGLLEGFAVDKVRFVSSFDEIKKGDLFDMTLNMHILGKAQTLNLKFDLKNIVSGIKKLAKEAVDKFVPVIKGIS